MFYFYIEYTGILIYVISFNVYIYYHFRNNSEQINYKHVDNKCSAVMLVYFYYTLYSLE